MMLKSQATSIVQVRKIPESIRPWFVFLPYILNTIPALCIKWVKTHYQKYQCTHPMCSNPCLEIYTIMNV